MGTVTQSAVSSPRRNRGFNKLVERYFYFAMSLLIAAIVILGFSRTANQNLFHASPPRPLLLWIHAAVFSSWVAFYILQAALVRTHNVKAHRFLGWFGVALGGVMIPLGFTVAIVMSNFDAVQLHEPDPTFLSIPFLDMMVFGTLFSLAILWRKRPEWHRRLLFIATCQLLDAPFGRFDFIFNHSLFYICVDLVILLGVGRDLIANRRIHAVYRYALPAIICAQVLSIYLWHGQPAWWLQFTTAVAAVK